MFLHDLIEWLFFMQMTVSHALRGKEKFLVEMSSISMVE